MRLKKFFSFFILLFFLISFPLVIYGQEELLGEITHVDGNKLAINNRFLKIDPDIDVIYKNQLGTQLISVKDIPIGIFGVAHLEDMTIKALEVSGRAFNTKDITIQKILTIPEYIDKFQLSYDEIFLLIIAKKKAN